MQLDTIFVNVWSNVMNAMFLVLTSLLMFASGYVYNMTDNTWFMVKVRIVKLPIHICTYMVKLEA